MSDFFESAGGIFRFIVGVPFMFLMFFALLFSYIMYQITGDKKWLQSPIEKPM